MAVVLSSEDNSHFAGGGLRRSRSQTQFVNPDFASSSKLADSYDTASKSSSESDPSSAPSSPRTSHGESTDASYSSTPASNLSIASDLDEALPIVETPEDHFGLPPYSDSKIFTQSGFDVDGLEAGDISIDPVQEEDSSEDTSRPDTPECPEHAEDDTAVSSRPSRQVDYLSHDWREEDIWTSWRYIVTRRGEFSNSARLENASWRTWMKAKNNLKTISPESLNWLKDCDVTWLYGPLQPKQRSKTYGSETDPSSSTLSKSDSLVNLSKKPILKKRTMSELMLQHSLSSASLLKQATAAVQAQETRRPRARAQDDYIAMPFPSKHLSVSSASTIESTDSSGMASPCTERKHIHFNEQVEQCIAIEVKGEDEEEMDGDRYGSDSDDSDGVVMKRVKSKKRPSKRKTPRKSAMAKDKIIAKLPSTKLKYQDTTGSPDSAMKHSRSPVLSPSSSQETLRPTRQANRFYFDEADDDDDADELAMGGSSFSRSGWRSPPGSGSLRGSPSSSSVQDENGGLRRTPSGMLMPHDEGEAVQGDGLIGRVIDTVNTARDIAHVIWNVGWRK